MAIFQFGPIIKSKWEELGYPQSIEHRAAVHFDV